MIPVIGIPYMMRPDLLSKMLEAIPRDSVERIHIIDNSVPEFALRATTDAQMVITRMHHNIGVAAAWNLIIKSNPRAPWWCILNSDLTLGPDDLSRLEVAMESNPAVFMGGMAAFGVRADAINQVGWFDENYIPAYCEDLDWHYRARILGVHVEHIPAVAGHFGSHVIKSSPLYQEENGRTYPRNRRYYEAKWGGFSGEETFLTPFDSGMSPKLWDLDMARLAALTWKE